MKYYTRTFRELNRLDSVTCSPILLHLSETLSGATTIRNFGKSQEFVDINYHNINTNMNSAYWKGAARRWFCIRLEMTGKIIIIITMIISVSKI